MRRFVCIHGHFYQPPRANPWLESVELQESAYPYHDWNERIDAECYAPNAEARILDAQDRITHIVDNYRSMSFNFGPTLLDWLAGHDAETYRAVLEADRASRERRGGHGSALAQAYGHAILPLCNARDRRTHVAWGVRDFELRFGRKPEGLWLPETAVCLDTLETLAEHGLRFTILAPGQAQAVRGPGERDWTDVTGGRIDTQRPYLARLPSGREIALFFYDAAISGAVAFGGLLKRGDELARRLLHAFPAGDGEPRLVTLATDGETFGHHHAFGDMALAYALAEVERSSVARLTNFGEFLELFPPRHEVRIVERSAWSCAHGVGRWCRDCGCSTGAHPDWKQHWRAPLREALDWLRDGLAPAYAREAAKLLGDPWAARDAFVDVLVEKHSPETLGRYFERHGAGSLGAAERTRAVQLLELQRQALLMYASCGWFFDDVSGIESVQLLRHAARAAELADTLFGGGWEAGLVERLSRIPSNLADIGDARVVYERRVRPAKADLEKVAANYAAGLLFGDADGEDLAAGFTIDCPAPALERSGRARLATGRLAVRSRVTLEEGEFDFAFMHLADHNLSGAVRLARPAAEADAARREVSKAFTRGDLAGALRQLERQYGAPRALDDLFGDRQRRIVRRILDGTLREAESAYHRLYEQHVPLLRLLKDLESSPPRALTAAAELVLNAELRRALAEPALDLDRIRRLFGGAAAAGVALDRPGLGYAAQRALESIAASLVAEPQRVETLEKLRAAVELIVAQPLDTNLRRVQNDFWRLSLELAPRYERSAAAGEAPAATWLRAFDALGRSLRIARS